MLYAVVAVEYMAFKLWLKQGGVVGVVSTANVSMILGNTYLSNDVFKGGVLFRPRTNGL